MADDKQGKLTVGDWIELRFTSGTIAPDDWETSSWSGLTEIWRAAEVLDVTSRGSPSRVRFNNGEEEDIRGHQRWRRIHS